MRNWFSLAPNLSSWINALLLAGLLIVATSLVPVLHQIWTLLVIISAWIFYFGSIFLLFLASILPQFIQQMIAGLISFISSIITGLITLISPFVLLLPIPVVAFAHHYLYLNLDRYYPDLDTAERGRVTGYFPNIVSWWHGLFALVVVIMAMLCSDSILSIFHLHSNLADYSFLTSSSDAGVYGAMKYLPDGTIYSARGSTSQPAAYATTRVEFWVQIALMILRQPIYRPFWRLLIWVVTAAYLYQFEFSFRQHLISNATGRTNSDRT